MTPTIGQGSHVEGGNLHPTAFIGSHSIVKNVQLGEGSKIWHFCNVYGSTIGNNTQVGSYTQIKQDSRIGDNCRVQDGVSIPESTKIGNFVFIGPRAAFANDKFPTVPKTLQHQYHLEPVTVGDYAVIGLGALISAGVTIGKAALIGAGAVVIKDVPDYAIVVGNPGKVVGDIRDEKYAKFNLTLGVPQ